MKGLQWMLFFLLASANAITQDLPRSLSCSRAGTVIIYVNGVWNSDKELNESLIAIRQIVIGKEELFDSSTQVFFDSSYNTSENKWRDLTQLLRQKLAQEKRFTTFEIDRLVAFYLFRTEDFISAVGVDFWRKVEGIKLKLMAEEDYNSSIDTSRLASKISGHLSTGRKVIVVTHSQGGIYANMAYELLLERGVSKALLDSSYGNLQIGSVAVSIKAKNQKHITHDRDYAIGLLREGGKNVLRSNYVSISPCPLSDFLCHELLKTYLAPTVFARGAKQGIGNVARSFQNIFIDTLQELAWTLGNNDSQCCDGRDGRYYRKDYASEPQPGFIGASVIIPLGYDLEMDASSQVCGEVRFLQSGEGSDRIVLEGSLINGESSIEVSGNVFLSQTVLNPFESGQILEISGAESGLVFMERTLLAGSPKISGSLIISDVNIYGNGSIQGEDFFVQSESYWHKTSISNVTINGGNLKGIYNLERNTFNTNIEGKGFNTPDGSFVFANILPNEDSYQGLVDSTVNGIVYLKGAVNPGVFIEGKVIEENFDGISLPQGNFLHPGARVVGAAAITEGSIFEGKWEANRLRENGSVGMLVRSVVYDVNWTGAPYLESSRIEGGTISDYPIIFFSALGDPTIVGDAQIFGENGWHRYFGWGYQSGTKRKTASKYTGSKEATKLFLESNRLMIEDANRRFFSEKRF